MKLEASRLQLKVSGLSYMNATQPFHLMRIHLYHVDRLEQLL